MRPCKRRKRRDYKNSVQGGPQICNDSFCSPALTRQPARAAAPLRHPHRAAPIFFQHRRRVNFYIIYYVVCFRILKNRRGTCGCVPTACAAAAARWKTAKSEKPRGTGWACISLAVGPPRAPAYYMGGGAEQKSKSSELVKL